MNYKDAFAIGSRLDGYIKCTYAELHSPDLGVLFSLQDNNFSTKNEAAQKVGAPRTDNSDETIRIMYDVPVVVADQMSEDKLVPVRLTAQARKFIIQRLSLTKHIKPKYAELIERIDTNSVFYVKPVAIDWIPTNIINVGLEKDLAEAKRKLDAAKAILATAGAATILL